MTQFHNHLVSCSADNLFSTCLSQTSIMSNHFELILQNYGLNHIVVQICSYLDFESLVNFQQVSLQSSQLVLENQKLWTPFYEIISQYITSFYFDYCINNNPECNCLDKIRLSIQSNEFEETVKLFGLLLKCIKSASFDIICEDGFVAKLKFISELENYTRNVNQRNSLGYTPLQIACFKGFRDTVEVLLQYPNINITNGIEKGNTPLHIACKNGHFDIIRFLCDHWATNINALNNNGDTPLHAACVSSNALAVLYLCGRGDKNIEINARDADGNTPLHIACMNDNIQIVKILFMYGIALNARNNDGNTALHFACMNGNDDIVQELCSNGIALNTKNDDGNTPLHLACNLEKKEERSQVIRTLCEKRGLDVNIRDAQGRTPSQILAHRNNIEREEALKLENSVRIMEIKD